MYRMNVILYSNYVWATEGFQCNTRDYHLKNLRVVNTLDFSRGNFREFFLPKKIRENFGREIRGSG
jgi:hypothetical protein